MTVSLLRCAAARACQNLMASGAIFLKDARAGARRRIAMVNSTVACRLALPSIACLAFAAASVFAVAARGRTQDIVNCDGYPCVNFAFGANVSQDGALFASTFYNPPYLGSGLEPLGGGRLVIHCGNQSIELKDFGKREVRRRWPFAAVAVSDSRCPDLKLRLRAYAPLALDDRVISSLPAALAEIAVENTGTSALRCRLEFVADPFLSPSPEAFRTPSAGGLFADRKFVAWGGLPASHSASRSVSVEADVAPGDMVDCRLAVGRWDENYPCAARCGSVQDLCEFLFRFWTTLRDATARLEAKFPETGDNELDGYLRWYATAGAAMTKTLKNGTALTMGYHELNQRDSYWTSWMHLVLWPSVERRMIEESVWGQRLDGKVPTTLLPLIERNDDADINCFFILRGLRYVRFHDDREFGLKILPALKSAADWLAERDVADAGLPEAASFWFDWKDVPGMSQRKYSPYTSMLYVAALERLADFCREAGDLAAAEKYAGLSEAASTLLNKPVRRGGLYNGRHYEHVWRERPPGPVRVSQDQAVGIVFDVIPEERVDAVLDALKPSINEWGARETYPYFEESFGYAPGDYHNGGIWPYMNHVHAWALLKAGRRAEAVDLLKRVAKADLEQQGDFIPHEYLKGETGEQAGVPMQGWNAAMFGTVYFGMSDDGFVP